MNCNSLIMWMLCIFEFCTFKSNVLIFYTLNRVRQLYITLYQLFNALFIFSTLLDFTTIPLKESSLIIIG